MIHSGAEHAVAIAKDKEIGMESKRRRRKHTFLRFEIEALRELPRKLSWMDWIWLAIELLLVIGLLLAVVLVRSCNG